LSRGDQHCFVARTTDLEIDFVLPLELNFTVIEAPGAVHQTVHSNEIVGLESVILMGGGAGLGVRLHGHAASPLSAKKRRNSIIAEGDGLAVGRLHEKRTGK
jgi:hypothetical protein